MVPLVLRSSPPPSLVRGILETAKKAALSDVSEWPRTDEVDGRENSCASKHAVVCSVLQVVRGESISTVSSQGWTRLPSSSEVHLGPSWSIWSIAPPAKNDCTCFQSTPAPRTIFSPVSGAHCPQGKNTPHGGRSRRQLPIGKAHLSLLPLTNFRWTRCTQ